MSTVFDIYAMALLLASLGVFVARYVRAETPVVPYLLIAIACGVGNWIGEAIDGFAGIAVLVIASFLFLSCLLYPHLHRQRPRDAAAAESA